jgi:hypothetical protein
MLDGEPVVAWATTQGDLYADYILPMEEDRSAEIAEHFLEGVLALVLRERGKPSLCWMPSRSLHHVSALRPN